MFHDCGVCMLNRVGRIKEFRPKWDRTNVSRMSLDHIEDKKAKYGTFEVLIYLISNGLTGISLISVGYFLTCLPTLLLDGRLACVDWNLSRCLNAYVQMIEWVRRQTRLESRATIAGSLSRSLLSFSAFHCVAHSCPSGEVESCEWPFKYNWSICRQLPTMYL